MSNFFFISVYINIVQRYMTIFDLQEKIYEWILYLTKWIKFTNSINCDVTNIEDAFGKINFPSSFSFLYTIQCFIYRSSNFVLFARTNVVRF